MQQAIDSIVLLEDDLKQYTKDLENKLRYFLGAAIILAGLGIVLLLVIGFFLIFKNLDIKYLLPFSCIIISLELISYFFLKCYTETNIRIKYFKNELTNLGLKKTALYIFQGQTHQECLGNIINILMSSERNHVLKEGESSIELKQMEFSDKYNSSIQQLTNLIHGNKP